MRALQWPLDSEALLATRKKILRKLKSGDTAHLKKKVAILGGSTTSNVRLMLELFLLGHGIDADFYESEYNQYYQDALFPGERFKNFKPDIIYIHTTNRNISRYPKLGDDPATVESLLQTEGGRFREIWQSLTAQFSCPIIQNNFEYPLYRLLGNKDASDIHGKVNFITRLNILFYQYAQEHTQFYINDIQYQAAVSGLDNWSDPLFWHMYKYSPAVPCIPFLAFNIANIIKSVFGLNKKGLVLDLDNTLWGGVVGDDGVDNLELGQEGPLGQAYSEFQQYLLELKQLGLLLSINSKNEMNNALDGLAHPDGHLHKEDFVCIKANWEPKDQNFAAIAGELNLLPESLVFIDDNPVERDIVQSHIPGVQAPPMTKVENYITAIDRAGFFETTDISGDDLLRNKMYGENAARLKQESAFTNYKEYLASLQMRARIKPFESLYMARITQLINKSNQFNLTTKRYTQSEIAAIAADDHYITLYGKLWDKFGDNGVVSVVIGKKEETALHLELWLMSCRVLKRGFEDAMLDTLVTTCENARICRLIGYYFPTSKNGMVKNFYDQMGFTRVSGDDHGNTVWSLTISSQYEKRNSLIALEDTQ